MMNEHSLKHSLEITKLKKKNSEDVLPDINECTENDSWCTFGRQTYTNWPYLQHYFTRTWKPRSQYFVYITKTLQYNFDPLNPTFI